MKKRRGLLLLPGGIFGLRESGRRLKTRLCSRKRDSWSSRKETKSVVTWGGDLWCVLQGKNDERQ